MVPAAPPRELRGRFLRGVRHDVVRPLAPQHRGNRAGRFPPCCAASAIHLTKRQLLFGVILLLIMSCSCESGRQMHSPGRMQLLR
jgi:hypothetical protein